MKPQNGLFFLPLGGAEEIGMNLNLYGLDGKWLMIDLGVAFGEDRLPGVDTVMPDPKFIEEQNENLVGLVLTHGHEDHLGAIRYLWPRLRCPIYATPFTSALLWSKLSEISFKDELSIIQIPLGDRFSIGPFDLQYITTTHSIPEPNAIALRTRLGTVLHTGDFKVDPQPVIGNDFDKTTLSKIGDEGVLAVVCDSTNVFDNTASGSESSLEKSFRDLISQSDGLVSVTTFSSNVARIQTAINAAVACDRHPILFGRSIVRTAQIAEQTGYLTGLSHVLTEKDIGLLPRDKVVIICTGSQGEERGALARIANGKNPNISFVNGDVTIFSSKIIPGNEKAISRLQNQLSILGVQVITEKDALVHVSGHPSREELAQMYDLTRPKISIPVHGERRHIAEHARLARQLQIPEAIEVVNGSVIQLAPGPAKIIQQVHSGRLALDGANIVSVNSPLIKQRRKLMINGMVSITILMDDKGNIVSFPRISTLGVVEEENILLENIRPLVVATIVGLCSPSKRDDKVLAEEIRQCVRKEIKKKRRTRPEILVEIIRI